MGLNVEVTEGMFHKGVQTKNVSLEAENKGLRAV